MKLCVKRVFNQDVIELLFGLELAEGGLSLHDNNTVIGMNIYTEKGTVRDEFISVNCYFDAVKEYLSKNK